MVSDWFDLPGTPILDERAEPHLVKAAEVESLRQYLRVAGASLVDVEIGDATAVHDVVGALKRVLVFPKWCGSSWDSMVDAFTELREVWPLPLGVVVHGLTELTRTNPHLGFETVLGLSRLTADFSRAGDQLVVFYVCERWGE